ncbi:MAG: type II toxin-antitoxin system RelE/ParE family toxin [Deltaproteobacteria bacterium]|nr:type II toxin-antitoxin system RelE/ParE family toxin [Deltaproteobacteria bacterium]
MLSSCREATSPRSLANRPIPVRSGKTGKHLFLRQRAESGFWRYHVGAWRVLCRIEDGRFLVQVVEIGHRNTVCK